MIWWVGGRKNRVPSAWLAMAGFLSAHLARFSAPPLALALLVLRTARPPTEKPGFTVSRKPQRMA